MEDHQLRGGFGFIVTRFGNTDEHRAVSDLLERVRTATSIPLVRADYALFAPDLWTNVQCYMHGCRFSISIFEDAEGKGYNPNVALETGYLLAIEKPIIVLKSGSLGKMPSDLLSKLYIPYDPTSDLSAPLEHILDWISRGTVRIDDIAHLPANETTLSQLLQEIYPSIKGSQPGDFDHITRHVGGLREYGYHTISDVLNLLEETEEARRYISRNTLPEFAICSVSHSLALAHPEYRSREFWKPESIRRIKEAALKFDHPL